jgi:integrase/recombinase XerC
MSDLRIRRFEKYENYLAAVGRSANTIRAYLQDLNHFAHWYVQTTGEEFQAKLVDSTELIEYRRALIQGGRRPQTINRRLVALRRYFKWAKQQNLCLENPFDLLEGYRVNEQRGIAPKWLDEKEQLALLRVVRMTDNRRDLAIIQTLRRTGLRVSELVALRGDDIVIGERSGTVRVRQGKGTKARQIPLSKDARQALSAYLEERRVYEEQKVFLGQRGPLTEKGVWDIVKKYAYQARLQNVTTHTLRHTFGKNLVNVSTPLDQVATLLGHERIETVRIYITPSAKDLEKAVRRASGEMIDD